MLCCHGCEFETVSFSLNTRCISYKTDVLWEKSLWFYPTIFYDFYGRNVNEKWERKKYVTNKNSFNFILISAMNDKI